MGKVIKFPSRDGPLDVPPGQETCYWREPHIREHDHRSPVGCGWRTLHAFESTPTPDDERQGFLTHEQINTMLSLAQQLSEANDADTSDELARRIRAEVILWPLP